ncbi:hydroxyethylthiazole kinase [Vagococcus sp. BWB3-3]|uniref:Hydroxyethylthiazole kinase n=1 Tax=Vagococcus allomyrinae TaxID=2794353 RepID=A0A940PA09_9ENTE|nr:hydroxyethylthiazole kinase [Vagococcus allomyrinae]MBP1044062.1 hydroxyethylthiazole kinase [Vagococcus allomyrinae]
MKSFEQLRRMKQQSPLVHNMTNQVVANHVANGLLAIGASPIMAYAKEEVGPIASLASCLVLNIGTITTPIFEAMLIAGHAANEKGVPIVLDPVGVGVSRYRQKLVKTLLAELKISLIRGNAGEIAQLAKVPWQAHGVDSGTGQYSMKKMAQEVALANQSVVAISGERDWISDGKRLASVDNGHQLMTRVTGMGCLLSGVCGAFIASHQDLFESTLAAHITYGIAGEKAAMASPFPGSFKEQFMDQLFLLNEGDQQRIKASEEKI